MDVAGVVNSMLLWSLSPIDLTEQMLSAFR
jgi:hypothetical protein